MSQYNAERLERFYNDILESVINAQNFILNKTRKEFLGDQEAIYAVKRCIENISRITSSIRKIEGDERYTRLPWREMAGMSRKINHLYQEIPSSVLWQTVNDEFGKLEATVRSILGDNIRSDIPKHKVKLTRARFVFNEEGKEPTFWLEQITPFVRAISDIQQLIDRAKGVSHKPVEIKSISRNSPLDISLDGAGELVKTLRDTATPWRYEHEKKMADLELQGKSIQNEVQRAEVIEKRIQAQKLHVETKLIESGTSAEIERKYLENEKLRLENEEARINLALKILDRMLPDISQAQRVLYTMELLKPLNIIVESPLLLESDTE